MTTRRSTRKTSQPRRKTSKRKATVRRKTSPKRKAPTRRSSRAQDVSTSWFWLELDGGHKILVPASDMPERVSYGDVAMVYPASRATQDLMDRGYDVDLTMNARSEGRRSSRKEINDLIQKARDQGWTVVSSSSGHWIFRSPDRAKGQVVLPGTPSDHRSLKNAVSALRRAGLKVNRASRRNPAPPPPRDRSDLLAWILKTFPSDTRVRLKKEAWGFDDEGNSVKVPAGSVGVIGTVHANARALEVLFVKRVELFTSSTVSSTVVDLSDYEVPSFLEPLDDHWGPLVIAPKRSTAHPSASWQRQLSASRRMRAMKPNRRRRVRRNPGLSTVAILAVGAGVIAGIALLSRRAAPAVPRGTPNAEAIAEAIRGARESEIARMMARTPGLTRAEAEARYDRSMTAITSIATAFTRS